MGSSASEVVAYAEAVQGTVTHVTPRFIPTPTLQSTAMIPRMPQRTGQRYPSLWALQSVGAGQPLGVNSAAYTGQSSPQHPGSSPFLVRAAWTSCVHTWACLTRLDFAAPVRCRAC
jgi:hypothetical protein